jgi:hypothetical protein
MLLYLSSISSRFSSGEKAISAASAVDIQGDSPSVGEDEASYIRSDFSKVTLAKARTYL